MCMAYELIVGYAIPCNAGTASGGHTNRWHMCVMVVAIIS